MQFGNMRVLSFAIVRFLFTIGLTLSVVSVNVGAQSPAPTGTTADEDSYPNDHLLVSTEWLAERLDEADAGDTLRVVDMRSPDTYAEAHIPGAFNIPVDAISSTIDGISMEFDEAEVQAQLGAIGLEPEMTVVIYDNLGMMNSGRLFWTLEYVGHEDVRILNGGWNAWQAEDQATTAEVPEVESTDYAVELNPDKIIDAEALLEQLDDPNVVVIDARSPQEYTGEASFSERSGHIPGAVNLVWLDALMGGDTVYTTEAGWQEELQDEDVEVFKSASEIQSLLDELGIEPEQTVITYCQTLWRGAHVYFLFRLMGYEDVIGYDGSWAEWGNRDGLPIVTGSEPSSLEDAQ